MGRTRSNPREIDDGAACHLKSNIPEHIRVVFIMTNGHAYRAATWKKKLCWIAGSLLSYLLLRFLWEMDKELLAVLDFKNLMLTTIAIGFIVLNSNLCAHFSLPVEIANLLLNVNSQTLLFPVGMIAHIISLSSSSFVEEEHQTWYFFWTTFLILLFCETAKKRCNLHLSIKILLTLLGHRILRKLNSTGNKYAHLTDIGSWLKDDESNVAMTTFLLTALGLLVWIGYRCEQKQHRSTTLIVHIAIAACIYLRQMANGTVLKFYGNSRGIVEVRIFWILILYYTLYWTYRLSQLPERRSFVNSLLRFIIQLWVMISSLLHRPHNVILLPIQLLCGSVIHNALAIFESGECANIYAHIWMGNVFYFYQGNSNSLATIDVAAGYVGLESYSPFVTGIFMSINTYCAPQLAYFTVVALNIKCEQICSYSDKILSINRRYALWRFLPVTVYAVIVTIQRFHLFVWTVFSPKLLYEAMHCAVMFIPMLLMQVLLGILHKNTR